MKHVLMIATLMLALPNPSLGTSEITRHVLGCGAMGASSAHHRIRATLGQDVIGPATSPHHRIHAGFWCSPRGEPPSGVEATSPVAPTRFHLYQNDPNPFNPRTTIRYDVPGDGARVRIVIYGVDGRPVHTLVDSHRPGGHQSVTWDGRDDQGRPMASGVYFLTLAAPGFQQTQRMVLLR